MQSLAVHRSLQARSEFVLHRPRTLAQACRVSLLSTGRRGCGHRRGIDVISRMKAGAGPAHVVAIAEIAEMHGVGSSATASRSGRCDPCAVKPMI